MTDDRKRKGQAAPILTTEQHVAAILTEQRIEALRRVKPREYAGPPPIPASPAKRQQRSRAARKAAGGRSVTVMLPEHAADALDEIREKMGLTATDAIAKALVITSAYYLPRIDDARTRHAASLRAKIAAEHPDPPTE